MLSPKIAVAGGNKVSAGIRQIGTAYTTTTTNVSHPITLPSYQAGDIVVILTATTSTVTSPAISGFTAITGSFNSLLNAFYKVMTGSEGATVNFTHGTTRPLAIASATSIRGASAFDTGGWGTNVSSGTTLASSNVPATTTGEYLFMVGWNGGTTLSANSIDNGATVDVAQHTETANGNGTVAIAHKNLASAGAPGTTTMTTPTIVGNAQMLTVLVKP